MTDQLDSIARSESGALYQIPSKEGSLVRRVVFSSPETRRICNDPLLTGLEYTRALQRACATCLGLLRGANLFEANEREANVLHILRGGLNFGLREALCDAFDWNDHPSAFISAQRARSSESEEDWVITESDYQKLTLRGSCSLVFGDVVATGTSLDYALHEVARIADEQNAQIQDVLFFTIGGPRSHEILEKLEDEWLRASSSYRHATVVYLEGVFSVATDQTPVTNKITGTDLLRRDSVLAPEFIESQYENPCYPIERCTIYDAGSRAFDLVEYAGDILEYWKEISELAQSGMTFEQLLTERFPSLERSRFGNPSLNEIASKQVDRIQALLSTPR